MNKILAILGTICLFVGIVLVMCLPYAEEIQLWNVRVGGTIGTLMIVSSVTIMGVLSEKR